MNDGQEYCSVRLNPYLFFDVNFENWADLVIPSRIFVEGKYHEVTTIDYEAFKDCEWIQSVTIPNTITSVEWRAFENCKNLTTVNWGENVEEVDSGTFSDCTSLTTITGISNIKTISGNAFANTSLEGEFDSIDWPSLTSISDGAFCGTKFSSVNLSSLVNYVGQQAFAECKNLTTVELLNENIEVSDKAFAECEITSITMPSHVSLHNIFGATGHFDDYLPMSLKTVNIVNSKDNKIPNNAFEYSYIENITLPEGITTIGEYAFVNSALKNINIPTSVTNIGNYAFYNSGLNAIYYKGTEEDWGKLGWSTNKVYYYSETKPTDTQNNYWHYDTDEKKPIVWESR